MLSIELAQEIFAAVESTSLLKLKQELFSLAIDYAEMRSRWPLLSFEERRERDKTRSLAHQAFMNACNILSRNMAHAGEDNAWREQLGDDRRIIGDFACYTSWLLGMRGR